MKKNFVFVILFAIVYSHIVLAALDFVGAGTQKVNCGSGTSVDNLTTYTVMTWIYPTNATPAAVRSIMQKSTAGTRRQFYLSTTGAGFGTEVGRATTDLIIRADFSNFSAASANTWMFATTRVNTSATDTDQEIYIGNLTTAIAEPSSYITQQVGTGTVGDDSADDLIVGGHPSSSLSFEGYMAWIGITNTYMSYADMDAQRLYPHRYEGDSFVLFMHLGLEGIGNQPDLSGNSNNGTVTGATKVDHPPMILLPWSPGRKAIN